MTKKQRQDRDSLRAKERKIYDSIMDSFPSTHPDYAYNVAIQGGIRFNFIFK